MVGGSLERKERAMVKSVVRMGLDTFMFDGKVRTRR